MSNNLIPLCTRVRIVATTLAAGAIAVSALGPALPAASAQPISQQTIKRECSEAGGSYQWWGNDTSTCTYRDIDGNLYRDYYVKGVYTHTD